MRNRRGTRLSGTDLKKALREVGRALEKAAEVPPLVADPGDVTAFPAGFARELGGEERVFRFGAPEDARNAERRRAEIAERIAKAALRTAAVRMPGADGPVLEFLAEGGLEALRRGGDRRVLARLRGGDFRVESILDLHGHSFEEGFEALEAFLVRHFEDGARCVLVVHGRGWNSRPEEPTLAQLVPHWLAQPRLGGMLTAFVSAPAPMGGLGALLVLLRREKSKARKK